MRWTTPTADDVTEELRRKAAAAADFFRGDTDLAAVDEVRALLEERPQLQKRYWHVEMRQAPFMLWVNDLSSRDPYFVLPLLMGGAMFAQFKLNPAPPDPMQAKIMQFMPLVMTAMMAWFPSGLVLYWLTNTVLSIVQQWRVNQVVQAEASKQR